MRGYYPLWGEVCWNEFGVFHYLSGFIGYMLLGLYLRKFAGDFSKRKTLAIAVPCWVTGFAVSFTGFLGRVLDSANGDFPVGGDVFMAAGWEVPWLFNSVGVALMTVGWILLFRLCRSSGRFYSAVVLPVSKASYGMYLCHMLALAFFSTLLRNALGTGTDGKLGLATTPVEILLTAVCSYICVAIVCVLIQRIPKVGKYIAG